MPQSMRCGSVEGEIASQQQSILVVVELVPAEASLDRKKNKWPGIPRLKIKLVAGNLRNIQSHQARIQPARAGSTVKLVTVAWVYS